jgi:multicomponent K+:H+ antiporter subunit D
VAAVFSIMTKVGVYAVLRMGSLLHDPAAPAPFGGPWLFGCAIATMAFGTLGMLGARHLTRLVAFTVIVSSGTLLAALGLGSPAMTPPALYYLLCATPATAAFFLLTGMTERIRTGMPETAAAESLSPATYAAFSVGEPPEPRSPDEEVGIAIPAAMAFLGLMFVCCVLLVTGLPPLAGFVAKFALLATAVDGAAQSPTPAAAWILVAMVLIGGVACLVALSRMGILLFWTLSERTTPRLRVIEAGPVALLVLASIALAVWAGPVMVLMESTASALNTPQVYIDAVLSSGRVAAP